MSERLRCEFTFPSKRRCSNTAVANGLCNEHGPIDALCARHGLTVEGIVALVDKLFAEDGWYLTQDGYPRSIHEGIGKLRRLARGEEA